MFSADSSGRINPVSSASPLDRNSFQALQEDVLDLQRVSDSGIASLTPHLIGWAKSGEERRHTHKAHHSSDERSGTQAPIGFSSDTSPKIDGGHECTPGMCVHPFPLLLVESAVQRYAFSADTLERYTSALTLSELFIQQCVQLLHGVRFLGGRDLFSQTFLHDIDEIMRGALWRGEAKGKKAAGDAIGIALDDQPASSPRGDSSEYAQHSKPSMDRYATIAAPTSSSSGSTANLVVDRARRRQSQDSMTINHPFAPSAYESTYDRDGPQVQRVISGAAQGGRGLSRRAGNNGLTRPRQCLLASLLALVRFTNALGTRLKYWRGQLKAKQGEIARLTMLAEAAKQNESQSQEAGTDANQAKTIDKLINKVSELETQLAKAQTIISEYEASGKVRTKYQPTLNDAEIDFNTTTASPHRQAPTSLVSQSNSEGVLAGQVAALQLELETSRQESLTLIRESADRASEFQTQKENMQAAMEALKAEIAAHKNESKAREEALASVQALADERELKINQLTSMLNAIKERVASREKEWEAKEESWKNNSNSSSSSTDTASPSASADAEAAARAKAAAEHEAREAEWFAQQAERDKLEAQLQAAATRAKQAHNAVLREYEELRRENVRVSAEVDAERKEMEARLKKCNNSLSEARATIQNLKAQIKKLQEEKGIVVPPTTTTPAAAVPDKPVKAAAAKADKEKQRRETAESLRQAELEMEAAEAAAAEEKRRATEAAAAIAAERIKQAAAKAKKEKAQRKKEAEALAAAAEAQAQAQAQALEEKKAAKKKKKEVAHAEDGKENMQPPKMAPPTAQELMKPTPKLSSGYGRCIYEEGEWYEGWWVNYERSGEGTYQWRDGRRYVGEWLNDKKSGKGRYFWTDGDRYEGQYLNDKMSGYGTYFFSDGTRYEGDWSDDMSHGSGTFIYADGARYSGMFQRDQKHGAGTMVLPSGEIFSEHWVNGKRISSVSVKQQQLPQPPQQMYHQQPPSGFQPQPPPAASKTPLSRNIRLAAQEQLQMSTQQAMSARGVGGRRF